MRCVTVVGRVAVEVDEEDLFRYVDGIANKEKAGRWIELRGPKGQEHRVIREEHHTSHSFDADADDQSITAIEKVEAADKLSEAIHQFRLKCRQPAARESGRSPQ